jgi:hypothetical protein
MKKFFLLTLLSICLISVYSQTLYVPSGTAGIGNNTTNSNVGIGTGTTAPTQKLEVIGSVKANNALIGQSVFSNYAWFCNSNCATATNYALLQNNNGTTYLNAATGTGINFRINNVTKMTFNTDGYLGINTSTPSAMLTINGTSGNTSMYVLGDTKIESGSIKMSRPSYTQAQASINISSYSGPGGLRFAMSDDGSWTDAHTFDALFLGPTGNVGIGTTVPSSKLTVKGQIICSKITVLDINNIPDYVFSKDYNLMKLELVAAYIKANNHLPNVPSASELESKGMDMVEMSKILLQKIEELTLYTIEQQEQIDKLNQEVTELKAKN